MFQVAITLHNLGLVAWSPLAGGLLTGKYQSGQAGDARYATEGLREFLPSQERQDRIVSGLKWAVAPAKTGRSG